MAKITTSNFQKGIFIEFRGQPCQIVRFQHVNPGKGSAFVRTKLKNLKTGKVCEFTYKSGEAVEELLIEVHEMQYLYRDNDNFFFMDKLTFEQVSLKKEIIDSFASYIKEGESYQIFTHDKKALGIRPPKKVKLLVTEAEEAVKGNTAMGAKKTVELETGIKTNVPLFIKKGDLIALNPETGEYLERVSQNRKLFKLDSKEKM